MANPNLRFKSFTNAWNDRKISDICNEITDFVAAGSFEDLRSNVKYLKDDGYAQLVRTKDLKNNFTSEDPVFISEDAYNYLWRVKLDRDAIVLPNVGNCGESYYISPNMLPRQHNALGPNAILVRTADCDTYFLSLVFKTSAGQEELKKITSPSGQSKFNKTELKNLYLSIPSINEQHKIAEFFTALDEKIRCLDDLAKGFSQSMQGVLNKVFTQQISFKDENGNNYSEWTIKKIKDVAPLQRGFDLPTSQLQDGECTVIYSNGQTAKHSSFKCDGCAVVTGRSGTIGKVFYLDNCKYWPHNTTLWVTDFCGNNPKFIYYLFKFVGLERFSTGTGVPTLNRNDVHDYVVKIPSIDEQTKIVEFLDCYNKKLNLLISKKHAFHKLKKAFMQRMFV